MAAFSSQHLHHPFHLLPPLPNNPTSPKMSDATADDFSQFYHPHQPSPLGHGREIQLPENESSLANKQSSESSIVVDKVESGEQVTQKINSKEKKRKKRIGSSSSSVQSKSKTERKGTKQKKQKDEKKDEKEVAEEAPPTGYIHVRARRGQATDSHSLAERVRREKISERMKMLQRLVPGCDKVTGKALVLDEIINYVQSLQNQVEFLSMKLASVNPLSYQFEDDLDSFMATTESMSRSMGSSNLQQCTGFTNYVSTISHPYMDHLPSILLDQRHNSMQFCDSVNLMWGGDPDQRLIISPSLSTVNHTERLSLASGFNGV